MWANARMAANTYYIKRAISRLFCAGDRRKYEKANNRKIANFTFTAVCENSGGNTYWRPADAMLKHSQTPRSCRRKAHRWRSAEVFLTSADLQKSIIHVDKHFAKSRSNLNR